MKRLDKSVFAPLLTGYFNSQAEIDLIHYAMRKVTHWRTAPGDTINWAIQQAYSAEKKG
jgi:hypothetical protein